MKIKLRRVNFFRWQVFLLVQNHVIAIRKFECFSDMVFSESYFLLAYILVPSTCKQDNRVSLKFYGEIRKGEKILSNVISKGNTILKMP